ncbi:hypothetical protein [Pseudomonas sp. PGPR40]|uniref:hypothetical protein n=1 Tax=Pseudomonas sp. PGPR40 TaxID=2913476 RepID=UPI001EDC585B|nr:hypothetical protein [Pseudomonas sp. PGPR40]
MHVKQFAASLDAVVIGMRLVSATHESPINDAKGGQFFTLDQDTSHLDYMALIQCFDEQEDE